MKNNEREKRVGDKNDKQRSVLVLELTLPDADAKEQSNSNRNEVMSSVVIG